MVGLETAAKNRELAFDRLDLGVVAIPLHADNDNSYRAVEKYVERHGGQYEGLLRNHAGRYDDPADHHRFSISQAEYETHRDRYDERHRSTHDNYIDT